MTTTLPSDQSPHTEPKHGNNGRARVLIWTRSIEDWDADRKLLSDAPASAVVHLPCIESVFVPLPELATPFDAWVFTSQRAAQACAADPSWRAAMTGTAEIWTVGQSTLDALHLLGFSQAVNPPGVRDGVTLAGFLSTRYRDSGKRVAFPAARETAVDYSQALTGRLGFRCEQIIAYETVEKMRHSDGRLWNSAVDRPSLIARLPGAVCFASPSAVRGFVAALAPELEARHGLLQAVCIGATTAAAAQPIFPPPLVAAQPSIAVLARTALELLGK